MLYQTLSGQNLPDEYNLSNDGLRLQKGVKEVKGLYSVQSLKKIELFFDSTTWRTTLKRNYADKEDVSAKLIFAGDTLLNVGVRYRGRTSYLRVKNDKKSFNISLDFKNTNQKINGYKTLNLNNSIQDQSLMREVLFENITRKYTPSLKSNFVNLYINGQNFGLYSNIQALDGKFIKEWYLNNDGTRWRAEKTINLDGGFGAGTSSFNYLGDDTTLYKAHYTLKHSELANPWTDLVHGTKAIHEAKDYESLSKIIDVDRTLWFLAKEILFGDEDSYVIKGGMDYFIYYDKETGRLNPLEFDANSVMSGSSYTSDIFLKESNRQYPLCYKLFNIPELRQRYLAHVRTMVADLFNPVVYSPRIDHYIKIIDSAVINDPIKLINYDRFLSGCDGIKSWMNLRRKFILSNPEVKKNGVSILEVKYSTDGKEFKTPDADQKTVILAKVALDKKIKAVHLYYGIGYDGAYTRLQMLDDGHHQDGRSKDGIYAAEIPGYPHGIYVRYYIEAVADDTLGTTTFSPQGAEHDVYIYRVNLAAAQNINIVINEIMSANSKSVKDQNQEFDDWIELFNKSSTDIDISKWILTDNPDNLDKYRFPSGTILKANSYLIIWADEDGKQSGYHANFKLSASGEPLILLDSIGKQVDMVQLPALANDTAYARHPNGTGKFILKSPTFNHNNNIISVIDESKDKSEFKIIPNDIDLSITIETNMLKVEKIKIFDEAGHAIYQKSISKETIPIQDWPLGIYTIKSPHQEIKVIKK